MMKLLAEVDEAVIDRLSAKFPEEAPIKRSNYIPDCYIGKNRVWRGERETITAVHGLYPAGALQLYQRPKPELKDVGSGLVSRLWHAVSRLTVLTVGFGAKFILRGLNTTYIHGEENLNEAIARPPHVPLLTVMNHNSCFDDPGLMGAILPLRILSNVRELRWSFAASEVIFSSEVLARFFALGKVVPVVRGWGPLQPAINFSLERLNEGSWVNIFPEGKVVDTTTEKPYRWGVGRLVSEAKETPLFMPIFHVGMNCVLPNPREGSGDPQTYVFRPGNVVTVCCGKVMNIKDLVEEARRKHKSPQEMWAEVTSKIEEVMKDLEVTARSLHKENWRQSLIRWHDSRDTTFHILT